VQPSLSEGWNTGVEEAHLFGKRILLSDIAVHREQNPDRATYFDARNPADLSGHLGKLFESTETANGSRGAERDAITAYGALRRVFARDFVSLSKAVNDKIVN
jgi:hypothetical protein